jgi:hypothetical protein
MKKAIFTMIIVAFAASAYADRIFLKDGEIIKGTIIQITDTSVEYDPEGERAFDVIDRKNIVKVQYDDGKVVNIQGDTLYRTDGTAVKGIVTQVTKDDITYTPEGETTQKTVARGEIERIEYADGKTVYITKQGEAPAEEKTAEKKPTGGFHDSWVRMGGVFSFGSPFGGIFDKERRVFRAYRPDLFRAYIIPRDYEMYNASIGGGPEFDFMPPAIKFTQKKAFDLTGIKFGIRGRYEYRSVDSLIVDESDYYSSVEGYELFRGNLLRYHYWGAGPVMNLIFSPRSNIFNFILNFYALGGQIFNGRIQGAAALRSAGFLALEMSGAYGPGTPFLSPLLANITNTVYFNKSRFKGYSIRGGFGPHFSFNGKFPFIFGINITYAYTNLKFGRALPIYYDGHRKAANHEVGGEITMGVHI